MIKFAVLNCYGSSGDIDFTVDIALSFKDPLDAQAFNIVLGRAFDKENVVFRDNILICQNSSFSLVLLAVLAYSSDWNRKAEIIINNVLFEDELKYLANFYIKNGGMLSCSN